MPRHGGKAPAQPNGGGRGKGPYGSHARPARSRGPAHGEPPHRHPALGTVEAASAHSEWVRRAGQGKGLAGPAADDAEPVAPWRLGLGPFEIWAQELHLPAAGPNFFAFYEGELFVAVGIFMHLPFYFITAETA